MKINSVLILAAGMGTRLKPFTNNLPKCLLPLGDTNILRALITLSQHYFPEAKIYINASYLAEKIINDIIEFPVMTRPHVIWESEPLGPAFTVSEYCKRNHHNVLVLHGDTYFSDLAFSQFAHSINQTYNEASVLLCHKKIKEKARSQIIEKNGVIKQIIEILDSDSKKTSVQSFGDENVWSSSGALVIKRGSLLNFTAERNASLSPTLINYIAYNEILYLEKCSSDRISIDNEKSYLQAIEFNKRNQKLFNRAIR